MVLGATIYRAELDVSDLDRGYYATHSLTVARHPSETEGRMMLRLLAFCLWGSATLKFIDGLSKDGEPALMDVDDTGWICLWVELGVPTLKQVRKAAGKSERVVVLSYDEDRLTPWWTANRGDFEKIGKLSVYSVADAEFEKLAGLCRRHMRLAVTVQDRIVYVADDLGRNIELNLHVLKTGEGA